MKYLHKEIKTGRNTVVLVDFDHSTQIKLLKDSEYRKYQAGKTYNYRGGFADHSPIKFIIPEGGTWHIIVERGGYFNPPAINASVQVLPAGTQVEAGSFAPAADSSKKTVVARLEQILGEE